MQKARTSKHQKNLRKNRMVLIRLGPDNPSHHFAVSPGILTYFLTTRPQQYQCQQEAIVFFLLFWPNILALLPIVLTINLTPFPTIEKERGFCSNPCMNNQDWERWKNGYEFGMWRFLTLPSNSRKREEFQKLCCLAVCCGAPLDGGGGERKRQVCQVFWVFDQPNFVPGPSDRNPDLRLKQMNPMILSLVPVQLWAWQNSRNISPFKSSFSSSYSGDVDWKTCCKVF